jgi:TolB protein
VKNNQIAVISTTGEFLGDIADVGSFITDALTWSPDGKRIAFGKHPSDNREVYIARLDGSGSERITHGPHNKYHLSWSRDGQYIAYSDDGGTGFENDIMVLDIGSKETWKLTHTSEIELFPTWSPDGKLIAFLSAKELYPPRAKLFVMDADGSNRQLTVEIPVVLAHLSWSPDGKQIAFSSGEMGCGQIYVVSLDDGELTQLTNLPTCAHSPTWSPDGRHIAFNASEKKTGDIFEQGWQIYIMNSDGSGITQLTTDPDKVPQFPYWAPAPALVVDANYAVTEAGDNLNLRGTAALGGAVLQQLKTGEIITILEGPVDVDDYYWWRIRASDGTEGWVAEVAGWYTRSE